MSGGARGAFVRTISPRDGLARPDRLADYYRVGLQALRLIEDALAADGSPAPSTIFDCASGYGRVTRMLSMGFPDSEIICWDRDSAAIGFCAEELAAVPAPSGPLTTIPARRYELIWCASLLTQVDEPRSLELLGLLGSGLGRNGKLIAAINGATVADLIAESRITPPIAPGSGAAMAQRFATGAGFVHQPYPREQDHGFGISLAARPWIDGALEGAGLELVSYEEAAWDDRQDVIICRPRGQRP